MISPLVIVRDASTFHVSFFLSLFPLYFNRDYICISTTYQSIKETYLDLILLRNKLITHDQLVEPRLKFMYEVRERGTTSLKFIIHPTMDSASIKIFKYVTCWNREVERKKIRLVIVTNYWRNVVS